MTEIELLLISTALAVNIFLIAEYEGSNLRTIRPKWVLLISLIFFAGQMISMGCGYLISTIPFFRVNRTEAIRALCCVMAALIFFVIGGFMLFFTWRSKQPEERAREVLYRRIILEAALVAVMTFGAGIACGFLMAKPMTMMIVMACLTLASAVAGLFVGFSQGARFRKAGYGISGALFVAMGIEILVRYI